jgi:hypothetical protein
MLAFEVARGSGAAAVDAMHTLGIRGLAVTMPHKSDVAAAVDVVDPAARALGSVNTVVLRDDGTTFGASTDGQGFVGSLLERGIDPCRGTDRVDRRRRRGPGIGRCARTGRGVGSRDRESHRRARAGGGGARRAGTDR